LERVDAFHRVFISYRRDDTAGHAGHLYSDLVAHFGAESVFMDTETIEPGADFTERLRREIESGDVLLALIGKRWLGRRLRDPSDFVRLEIQSALDRKLRVIPVLVQGARMPSVAQLPETIAELSHRNALEISDSRWRHDVERLVAALQGKRLDMDVPELRETSAADIAPRELQQPSARESLLAAIAEARKSGDRSALAGLLDRAGKGALAAGDLDAARVNMEESVSIFRSLGSTQRVAETIFDLGVVVDRMGRYTVARDYWEESIRLWRSLANPPALAAKLLERGRYGLASDRLDEASDDCIEALEIFVQSDNAEGASRALFNLAIVIERSGDNELARRLLAEAMGRWADPADPDLKARLCFHLGRLTQKSGHGRSALRLWLDSLEAWHQSGNVRWTADILARLSTLRLAQGDAAAALKLGGAASMLYSGMAQNTLSETTRSELAGAASLLPEKAVWQAWSEGCALDADGAVRFALQLIPGPR
jgi:tetratricopeptide (TPR) repeat protein